MSRICSSMSLQFTICGHAPAKSEDTKAPGRHLCLLERHLESRSQRPHQNELTTERKLFCQALALQAYWDGLRRLGSQRHFVVLLIGCPCTSMLLPLGPEHPQVARKFHTLGVCWNNARQSEQSNTSSDLSWASGTIFSTTLTWSVQPRFREVLCSAKAAHSKFIQNYLRA